MTANNGRGCDHTCSVNPQHATYDPKRWRTGEQCPAYHLGQRCDGHLLPVGPGSRREIQRLADLSSATSGERSEQ
jgi:hypothetical protein